MLVVEQFLHGFDGRAGIKQQGCGGGAERMRRVDAVVRFLSVLSFHLMHCAGQAFEIPHQQPVHGALGHAAVAQRFGVGRMTRAE